MKKHDEHKHDSNYHNGDHMHYNRSFKPEWKTIKKQNFRSRKCEIEVAIISML